MKNEIPPSEGRLRPSELVHEKLERLGVEIKENHADLTSFTNEEVINLFGDLVSSGEIVLHGTNADNPYAELEPRQANDASKESGNKKAVYATVQVEAALNHAVFNKTYALGKLRSFVWGEEINDGKMIVGATPELYRMFKEHDPQLIADGYVYVLDKNAFVSAPDAGEVEFHSEESQKPLATCKVSKKLGDTLFIVGEGERDTVREYTLKEIEEMAVQRERFQKAIDQ
jgi:hypothetical protein